MARSRVKRRKIRKLQALLRRHADTVEAMRRAILSIEMPRDILQLAM
jgi:hypothetical protein